MPARLIQIKALLLLAVFLSAGTSLPSLDSLLFHQAAGEPQRSQTHVEPAGGCLDHAAHCGLARTASGSGAISAPSGEITTEGVLKPAAHEPSDRLCFTTHHTGIPQPRAPPARLA
jgi:hypothetical protein